MKRNLHKLLYVFIITFVHHINLVQSQDQTGFITLDCGLSSDGSPYTDPTTGLIFTSDSSYLVSGKTSRVHKDSERNFEKALVTLRYFPDGERNCYNLNVTQGTNYLIRAIFLYGNYDGRNIFPNFDLFIGPNKWKTIDLSKQSGVMVAEMIHLSKLSSLQICLVKTGTTIPMITTLELRPLRNDVYISDNRSSLNLVFRGFASNSVRFIRYPVDIYDRNWAPFLKSEWMLVTTTLNVNTSNGYDLPQSVMVSAATNEDDNGTLDMTPWVLDSITESHIYLHFAELETLLANETREFNVLLNGKVVDGPYSPKKLSVETMISKTPNCDGGVCLLQLTKTSKSTRPPLLNAVEIFSVVQFPQSETNQEDVVAIKNLQEVYGLSRISWQGDPCVPKEFLWDGLNCENIDTSTPPTIISLNLPSSGLTGIIALAIQNLTHLQELDLSNNDLTGVVPEFLADMKSLLIINLSGNNLSGQVPQKLLQKQGLKLNVDGNPNLLCTGGSCLNKPKESGKSMKRILVPVIASVASMVVLITALILFLVLRKKKTSTNKEIDRTPRSSKPHYIPKKKKFTYAEVCEMTNNFERLLGKGESGIVYHGCVNGTEQVAVKVLYQSSVHSHKQFKAKIELLARVHHKNLVSLVGYCESEESILVYEYMANADLQTHLIGRQNTPVLSWGTRLKIAVEAAQGLEYLHKGCKPPIIHGDIKTANILLDGQFQAKLTDFGLSRSFPTEDNIHMSIHCVGTPGYLDSEYYITNMLTEKTDVYSFGVVLSEIITSQPVVDRNREKLHIAEWLELMVSKGDIRSIIDPKLNGDYYSDSVWKAIEVAMSCLNKLSAKRPTISEVVIKLNECIASENSRAGESGLMKVRENNGGSIKVSMSFGNTDVNPTAR